MTVHNSARCLSPSALFAAMLVTVVATTSAKASVEISADPTKNMNCTGGVCSPTAKKAVLNATDLANMLATSDVKVVTGSGAVTITVSSSFSWTSSHRLTLDANLNVSFRAPVVVAGQGAVTIVTNDGGTGGDLIFFPNASLDFWDMSSSLIVNGYNYLLVSDISSLANAIDKRHGRSGAFALAQNYDAKDDSFDRSPIYAEFHGRFEGLGHSIDNLTITNKTDECVGLFGSAGTNKSSVVLRDIILNNAYVSSSVSNGGVGTLVGCKIGDIVNVAATGSVVSTGSDNVVGGLVGVSGEHFAVGEILRCHAGVEVSSTGSFGAVGGLIGAGRQVYLSSATGSVAATGYAPLVGGLAGECTGCFQNFATGNVTGNGTGGARSSVGGLFGVAYVIEDSYATGEVTGSDLSYVGGLIGAASGNGDDDFARSYSIGKTSGGADLTRTWVGGFVGTTYGENNFTADYWNIDTSQWGKGCGRGDCTDVTALTDAQLKSALPAGFDPNIWGQSATINNGYPHLLANPPPQ